MLRSALLTAIVLYLFGCITILQAQEIPSFSTAQDQYPYFDQNFNVVQRLRTEEKRQENLMSVADKAPVAVNLYKPIAATVDAYEEKSSWLEKVSSFVQKASGRVMRCSELLGGPR